MKRLTDARLKEGIQSYFADCDERNEKKLVKPYSLAGLCLYLGITRTQFDALHSEPKTSRTAAMAKLKIEAFIEENLLRGDISASAAAGSLKYNFGWSDKPDKPQNEQVTVRLEEELSRWAN